jgi:hypothetical protein
MPNTNVVFAIFVMGLLGVGFAYLLAVGTGRVTRALCITPNSLVRNS